VKGAFTDAKSQKRGLAEMADGGTLFLDEIGEIPLRFQAKLLRFLETGEIRRVGGTRDVKLNDRILCATNQPLEELLQKKQFRDDLYYRLNVLSVTVPPLREHKEDIPLLVSAFIGQLGFQKTFDAGALRMLAAYEWPGNVRELRNVVERACIMAPGLAVTQADLAFVVPGTPAVSPAPMTLKGGAATDGDAEPAHSLAELERQHIIRVLQQMGGHKAKAAEILGISSKTLYNKIRVYGIKRSYQ